MVLPASVALEAAKGRSNNAIAKDLGVSRPTVCLWRERMASFGVDGILHDATRPGRRPALSGEVVARVVEATRSTRPEGATHWLIRGMARAQGISPAAVQRI